MFEPKITAIIVLFNKDLDEDSICIKIRDYADVIVVDNSVLKNENRLFCENHSIKYISMGGNKGLSKAYNTAINSVDGSDIIVLLDDDTDVSKDFFISLRKAIILNQDVDIFVPIIRGQDGVIYSPNNYNFLKNKLVSDPKKEIIQSRFNAISSCMAIRTRVFENYRYNEKLFVDEIDHCFCREQRNKGRKFAVIDVEISQNFHQRNDSIKPEAAWKRVKIRIVDIFRHARIIGKKKYVLLAFIKSCGIGVQMGKKSRSVVVIMKIVGLSCKLFFIPN